MGLMGREIGSGVAKDQSNPLSPERFHCFSMPLKDRFDLYIYTMSCRKALSKQ